MSRIERLHPNSGRYVDEQNNVRSVIDRVTGTPQGISSDHSAIHEKEGYNAYVLIDALAASGSYDLLFETGSEKYVHLKNFLPWISTGQGLVEIFEAPASVTDGTRLYPVNRSRVGAVRISEVGLARGVTTTVSNEWDIIGVDTTEDEVTVNGDQSAEVSVGDVIEISGSTGNDDFYRVTGVEVDDTPETTISVAEDITDATVDGDVTTVRRLDAFRIGGGGDVDATSPGPGGGEASMTGGNTTLDIEYVFAPETEYILRLTNEAGVAGNASLWVYWYEEGGG